MINAAGLMAANTLLGIQPLHGGINDPATNRTLRLRRVATGERIELTYWRGNWYVPDALDKVSMFLRDPEQQSVTAVDPALLDFLHAILKHLAYDGTVTVFDATVSKETMRKRAQAPGTGYSVARERLHGFGRALDFTIPALGMSRVFEAASDLGRGGVGFLEGDNMVHIDTGEIVSWRA
ncbi:hypothetical protein Salmuc_01749 [Salipiger mucosus DSM 16094]|uniref:Murein endopeptidase K n=2 Tax=Salipiger mucosus TaxID=263378 RepID=S9SCL1_9RHOB|nr:hypothetical protein Salmuc_01749 [Salipiger mucosus DSM 16094]